MHYTVTWHPDARDELARIWLSAADRAVIVAAAHAIDQILANDA